MLLTYKDDHAVPIINYHFFSTDTSLGLVCSRKDLLSQITYLRRNFTILSLPRAFDILENGYMPKKCVCITIDDGDETFFNIAWPIFKGFDVPIHVNLITGNLGKTISSYGTDRRLMNMKEISTLISSDIVTIASHSMSHKEMNGLSISELEYEIVESKKVVDDIAGESNIFCYPYGGVTVVTRDTEKVLYESGFRYALTTAGYALHRGTDRYRVGRISILDGVSVNKLRFYTSRFYDKLRYIHDHLTGNRFYNQLSIAGRIGMN